MNNLDIIKQEITEDEDSCMSNTYKYDDRRFMIDAYNTVYEYSEERNAHVCVGNTCGLDNLTALATLINEELCEV